MRYFHLLPSCLTPVRLWGGLILLVGWLITGWLVHLFATQHHNFVQTAFNAKARDVVQNIEVHAQRMENRLRTMAAMHQTQFQQKSFDAKAFNSYVEVLYSLQQYKVVRSFSFVERVPTDFLPEFERQRRLEDDSGFEVHTQGSASNHYIVKYIQPLTPNKSLLGLDLGTNAAARENLEQAIASNALRLSSDLNFARTADSDITFMLSLPVFVRSNTGLDSEDASQELVGVFNAIFAATDVLNDVAVQHQGMLNFELFENDSTLGDRLVFSGDTATQQDEDPLAASYIPRFTNVQQFTVAGRSFTLKSTSTAIYDQKYIAYTPAIIGLVGVLLSIFTAWLVLKKNPYSPAQPENTQAVTQAIMDRLPGLVAFWGADLRCQYANGAYLEYFGRTPAEMQNIRIQDLMSTALYALNESFIFGALQGNNQSFERKITKPNGDVAHTLTQYICVKQDQTVTGFIAFITDITHFKLNEIKTLFSEVALNTISQGIVVTNNRSLVQYVNPAFTRITGYSAEEVLGDSTKILQGRQTDADAIKALNSHIASGTPVTQKILNYHKDGHTFWNEMSISPVRQSSGEIVNFVGVIHDITQRVEAEQEIARALIAEKNAHQSKTMFLANTSHEMRTPLHGMMGMLQLLQRTPLSSQQKEYAAAIFTAAKSLLDQINQVLDLSKLEAKKITLDVQPMQLETLRVETMQWLPILTNNKPVHIRFDIDADIADAKFLADAGRLRQVIINLSSNAIRFTPQGEVHITIEEKARSAQHCSLEFSVRDTGIGISKSDIQRIFNNFEQVDTSTTRSFDGTGLGLPISKQLIELMGGELEVQSEIDVGSRFYFCLDLPFAVHSSATLQTTVQETRASDTGLSELPLHNVRVLVAEDNPLNQKVARMLLESEGAEVEIVENGKLVVGALAGANKFDIVLMDLQMPVMDGYAATQAIRQDLELNELPIIAMTASAMLTDRESCLRAGMNDHISKPFNSDQLVSGILNQLHKKEIHPVALG